MWKIKKWFQRKSLSQKEYEEEKREFEMAIGKPFITLKIELPEGFEDQRTLFLKLEYDEEFRDEVKDLIKKNLLCKRKDEKTTTMETYSLNRENGKKQPK